MNKKDLKELIINTEKMYNIAQCNAQKIAKEAQKYIDWCDYVTCDNLSGDGLMIQCDTDDTYVVPVDTFFLYALKNKKVTEEDFIAMGI